jgi:hypothetical protein
MNIFGMADNLTARQKQVVLALVGLCLALPSLGKPAQTTFDVIQIGTRSYTNVTVTSKTPKHIFVAHSGGIAGIKVSELTPELRLKLGYPEPPGVTNVLATGAASPPLVDEHRFQLLEIGEDSFTNASVSIVSSNSISIRHAGGVANLKVAVLPPNLRLKLGFKPEPIKVTNAPASPAARLTQELARIQTPPAVKQLEKVCDLQARAGWRRVASLSRGVVGAGCAVLLLLYVIFCRCCVLICRHAHVPASPLVYFPILQLFPLLRAADMSYGWFLAWFVPGLNLAALILWSIKISRACGRSGWVALFLALPGTNVFAFLFLAFSGNRPVEKQPASQIMRLGVAG